MFDFHSILFLFALGVVQKVGSGWAVFSETGKKLSKIYKTKKEANERLKEIEYFKNKKGSK
jgi:hypothetical protein